MTETTLTPGQMRINEMASHLHIADQNLAELIDHLHSAGVEFEAALNGDDNRLPCQQQMKTKVEEALREIASCSTQLAYAFEKPIIQALLKAYRCQEEGEPVVVEVDFASQHR